MEAAIKHFESLQKRYTTQHNEKQCEHVECALMTLRKEYTRMYEERLEFNDSTSNKINWSFKQSI